MAFAVGCVAETSLMCPETKPISRAAQTTSEFRHQAHVDRLHPIGDKDARGYLSAKPVLPGLRVISLRRLIDLGLKAKRYRAADQASGLYGKALKSRHLAIKHSD
jgi:hypothetical protein